MKKSEEALRRLKKNQKPFSLFGGSNTAQSNDKRDEERTRSQMILDVNAFSKDAESLGIDVLASNAFNSLHTLVYADLIEGETCSLISIYDELTWYFRPIGLFIKLRIMNKCGA